MCELLTYVVRCHCGILFFIVVSHNIYYCQIMQGRIQGGGLGVVTPPLLLTTNFIFQQTF